VIQKISTLTVAGKVAPRHAALVSPEALAFLEELHRLFEPRRRELLARRAARQAEIESGRLPDFLPETAHVRSGDWKIAPLPQDLLDRRVEITGPVDRKMMINALNSGASVFMADFEDSHSPLWESTLDGQQNLSDAIDRTIELTAGAKTYKLNEKTAVLLVRPRGWHLSEKHVLAGGEPLSASLFDFGLYFFHNHARLAKAGTGPYFYLPKMESHLEARLWNDVFLYSEERLGVARGTIKATVLIETILAAFEMDEILFELREHSAGLNAGRWDYLFSAIKKLRHDPSRVLPDRAQLTMTVPFMRAYTELLVKTCHRRGAHAMGGMSAFIPNRRDPAVTEAALAKVREDKLRESNDGFDGTWVAHPDLVPVAKAVFDAKLGARPNQIERQRPEVSVAAKDLLALQVAGGAITEAGLRLNASVALQYLESWLRGTGAVAINNLMEDAATAEISRSQLWQWVRHGARLADGRTVTADLVRAVIREERAKVETKDAQGRWADAAAIFEKVALGEPFIDFLTLPAYEALES
jgi:malate synthase